MKIISLQAENIKRLVAVQIDPKGNMVQLTGKNAQGKSSVLDAIWLALKYADVKQEKPVREGEETGRIRLDLGEIIVTRKFKVDPTSGEHTSTITVTAADGATHKSPQTMLDGLLSSLTFDPLEFSRADPDRQVKAIRRLLPGIDFEKTAGLNKTDFDARTELNRKARDLKGELVALHAASPEEPVTRVDKTALVTALTNASTTNADIEKRTANRADAKEEVKDDRAEAERLVKEAEASLVAAKAKADELKIKAQTLEDKLAALAPLAPLVDVTVLAKQINDADAHNALVDAYEKLQAKKKELATAEAQATNLTMNIDARNAAEAAAIQAAKLPVEGLSLGPDGVMLKGLPFNQASGAERLRTSAAIAMSHNPKLRVILIKDGSLLDEDGLALLAKMAEEHDYQLWIERVDSSGTIGFVLEDGHVKGQVLAPVEEPAKKAKPKAPAAAAGSLVEAPPARAAAPAPAEEPSLLPPLAPATPVPAPKSTEDDGL